MRHNGTAVAQNNKLVEQFKSPQLLIMLLLGIALVIGAPYLALRTLPGVANPVTGETSGSKGDPNPGMDFQILADLPPDVAQSARDILSQEEPVMPESLVGVPEHTGGGLIYPVLEAIETVQPTLSWNVFDAPPYRVAVKNQAGQTVASANNLQNPFWVMNVKLTPGAVYTWTVTAANGNSEEASFVVMTLEEMEDWRRLRSKFGNSHLALGLAAQHYGLLTTAEQEYQELLKEFPRAEAPGRLLANVLALRE
jgi:hypothetical protein